MAIEDEPFKRVVRARMPPHVEQLLAWLKANPNRGTAATVGAGSAAHLCGIYLQNATVTEFQFVPYRGGGIASESLKRFALGSEWRQHMQVIR